MNGAQPPAAELSIRGEIQAILKQAVQVWRMVPRRHKLALGGAALVMALTAATNTAIPLLLGRLVDQIQRGMEQEMSGLQLYHVALFFLGWIAVCYVVREVLLVGRRYLVERSCTRMEKVLTVKLVAHLMKVDLNSLTQEKIGALEGRINRSVIGFMRLVRLAFLDFFPPVLAGTFALTAALFMQPWLALAMVGVIPLSLFLTVRQITTQKGIRLQLLRSREDMEASVVELLGGLDYVRAANTQEDEVGRLAAVAEKRRAKELRHHIQMSLFGCAKAINEGFFHVVVLALAIYLAVHQQISYGDILTFSVLFMNVMAPLNEIHRGLDEGHECSLQVADLLAMLREPVDRSFAPPRIQEARLVKGQPVIEANDLVVEYRLADGQKKRGLDGVSMTIHHGDTIGVAGRSGCGKTTWLRVLMRLTHPNAGRVQLGGTPIEHVSRDNIGGLIGYVGQTPFVFAGTIAENIAYGNGKASLADIERAARDAFLHDEILAMPDGYQAAVAERGRNLSGGQRQRLALARVFLKNPPILILDEGTSALDAISERNVQRAIAAAREDRTVILVAHRLTTLLDADRIFVFDDGRMVEAGTYPELLRVNGVFADLARHTTDGANRWQGELEAMEAGDQLALGDVGDLAGQHSG